MHRGRVRLNRNGTRGRGGEKKRIKTKQKNRESVGSRRRKGGIPVQETGRLALHFISLKQNQMNKPGTGTGRTLRDATGCWGPRTNRDMDFLRYSLGTVKRTILLLHFSFICRNEAWIGRRDADDVRTLSMEEEKRKQLCFGWNIDPVEQSVIRKRNSGLHVGGKSPKS